MDDDQVFTLLRLERDDLPEIYRKIEEISQKGLETRPRKVDIEDMLKNGFGDKKIFHAFVLKRSSKSESCKQIVGYAFYIYLYSTSTGPFISVDDLLIFTEDKSSDLKRYFIKQFLETAQAKSLSRLGFQVPRSEVNSSWISTLGIRTLPQWYTVRFCIPALQSMTSSRNEQVHTKYSIRDATLADMESIIFMIQCLAEYENENDDVEITTEELKKSFGQYFQCFVAEAKSTILTTAVTANEDLKSSKMPHNPAIVGMAVYLPIFCKRVGRVLHLEDLFVCPEYRKQGIGTELMKETAKVALATGCVEMDLQVLDWNTNASDLYLKLGGELVTDYVLSRIERRNFGNILARMKN